MNCGKSGEMPIERRDSWFSPKCIEVQRLKLFYGGRALNGLGVLPDYRTQPNSEYHKIEPGSETVSDKIHRQKGNSPDRQLRALNDN